MAFLSTPSARRATCFSRCRRIPVPISIHALREEGDAVAVMGATASGDFYPRPPRGGRPARADFLPLTRTISIHALREEGDIVSEVAYTHFGISIHALREEGDSVIGIFFSFAIDFYPRPPRGGRRARAVRLRRPGDFYPRPPRGGRPEQLKDKETSMSFLSTPSARRAT